MKKYLVSILIIIILVGALSGCGASDNKPSSADYVFVKPQNYAAIVNVEINPSFDIYLDEKKVQLKEDKTNPDIISYGFGEYRTIQDYPIRGRATYLHVRKRKWLDKSSNEIFSYDWDLSEFDGTRLNSEFVSFLKEGD